MQLTLKNWKGEQFKKLVKLTAAQRLEAAAILLQNEIKKDLSNPSPPRSAPGNPPHKDTGRLRGSVSREVDATAMLARVGTNLEYGKFLELGTIHIEARPFLRKGFNEHRTAIMKILKG